MSKQGSKIGGAGAKSTRYADGIAITLAAALFASFGCRGESRLKEFSVPGAGFAVKMPGSPKEESKDIHGEKVTVFSVHEDNGFFSAQFKRGPEIAAATKDELREYFAKWAKDAAADMGARIMKHEEANFDGNRPGRFFEFEFPKGGIKQQVRIILANDSTYVLMVAGKIQWSGWSHARTFFDSFRFVP